MTRKSSTVAFIASSDYYGGDAKQSKDILEIVNTYYGCPSNAASEKGINTTSAIKDRMLVRHEEISSISDSGNTLYDTYAAKSIEHDNYNNFKYAS